MTKNKYPMEYQKDIEKEAIDYLKQYESTDVWEQTDLVTYVLDKAVELGLVKYDEIEQNEIDIVMDSLINKVYNAPNKPEMDYVINRYFTYNEREFHLFIRDYSDRRYKKPVQLLVLAEVGKKDMSQIYFYRKIISHSHGMPTKGIKDYYPILTDVFWNLITTDLYLTNPKLEMTLDNFSTQCALDKLP